MSASVGAEKEFGVKSDETQSLANQKNGEALAKDCCEMTAILATFVRSRQAEVEFRLTNDENVHAGETKGDCSQTTSEEEANSCIRIT